MAKSHWEQFGEEYAESLQQLRNDPWVEFVPIEELLPLREYHWNKYNNRMGEDKWNGLPAL